MLPSDHNPTLSVLVGPGARLGRAVEHEVLEVFTGWSFAEVRLGGSQESLPLGDAQALLAAHRVLSSTAWWVLDSEAPSSLEKLCFSGETPAPAGRLIGLAHRGARHLEAEVELFVACAEALRHLGIYDFEFELAGGSTELRRQAVAAGLDGYVVLAPGGDDALEISLLCRGQLLGRGERPASKGSSVVSLSLSLERLASLCSESPELQRRAPDRPITPVAGDFLPTVFREAVAGRGRGETVCLEWTDDT